MKPEKIIFLRPNYKSHIITPPLGIGYLASWLKKHDFEVLIIDALRDNLSEKQILDKIVYENPSSVGITCLTAFYNETVSISKAIKKLGIKVTIGGVHPTFLPYSTLVDTEADYVICGEGEIASLKLAQNGFINNGIKGVYSLQDLKTDDCLIKKSEVIEDLDSLPFPDWEQISPISYPRAPHGAVSKNFPIGIITSTRGCPYECTFCASPGFYDRKIRFRSPENVVEEIKYFTTKFGVKEIHFEDDNLTVKKEHIEKICNLILENRLKISWACPNGIRADKVDKDLISLMKKSGCYYFAYGVESANPQILLNVKKSETIQKIEESIITASKEGIECQGFFIFGLPGETRDTIKETIDFAVRSKLARAQFLILDVLPGSKLWKDLQGKFKPNFAKNSYKEPEWIPENLTQKELLEAQSKAFKKFYMRPQIFFRMLKFLKLNQFNFLIKRFMDYRIVKG